MGTVIKVIAGAALIAGAFLVAGPFGSTIVSQILFAAGSSLALNAVSQALTKRPGNGALNSSHGRQFTTRSAAAPRVWVYGRQRVGGVVTWIDTDGTTNDKLHVVVTLTGHIIQSVDSLLFDGVAVPLSWTGLSAVGTGAYAGLLSLQVNTGEDGQEAFTQLVANQPAIWTTDYRQRGCAGVYLDLTFDETAYPNGLPNITFDIQGKLVHDPRLDDALEIVQAYREVEGGNIIIETAVAHGYTDPDGDRVRVTGNSAGINPSDDVNGLGEWVIIVLDGTHFELAGSEFKELAVTSPPTVVTGGLVRKLRYSENAAVCIADYEQYSRVRGGLGAIYATEIDEPVLIAGANICDVDVDLGTSPETSYKQFAINGAFDLSETPGNILTRMAGAMAGFTMPIAGKWNIIPYSVKEPVMELTDDDIIGPMEIQTKRSARDLFNGIKGTCIIPENGWIESDFEPLSDDAALAEDGGERIWKDIFLPFTINVDAARAIAAIDLSRNRNQLTATIPFKMRAYQAQPGDVISQTHSRFGWSQKWFEVTDSSLAKVEGNAGGEVLAVSLSLADPPGVSSGSGGPVIRFAAAGYLP